MGQGLQNSPWLLMKPLRIKMVENLNKLNGIMWLFSEMVWLKLQKNLSIKANRYLLKDAFRTRNWEDRDGHFKSITEIIADNFIMLGKRRPDSQADINSEGETENDLEQMPVQNPISDVGTFHESSFDDLPIK